MKKEFIKSLLTDVELTDKDYEFLSSYIEKWLVDDNTLFIEDDTIALLKKNEANIEILKSLLSKNKIMDIIDRKIVLSQIANGDLTITDWKSTKDGLLPVQKAPTFNERINAIQVLNALDAIDNSGVDRIIIIDDIKPNENNMCQDALGGNDNEEIK